MSPENKKYIISLQKKKKRNKYGSQYNTQERKRNMNNIKTGKDSNTNNESSDGEASGDQQLFGVLPGTRLKCPSD